MVLIAATAIVKIIGAIYKIPLGNYILGETGMGHFSAAYDLYAPIFTIAMSGFPLAVAKLVAESMTDGRYKDAVSFFRISKKVFFITGILGTLAILIAMYPYMWATNNWDAIYPLLAVAPSMLFCCIMASYRGYYEGHRNMIPTGVSSVIETLGKAIIGITLSYITISYGMSNWRTTGKIFGIIAETEEKATLMLLPYGAAAAIAGVTLGTVLGMLYLMYYSKKRGNCISKDLLANSLTPRTDRQNIKLLLLFSFPIVLGALAQNISGVIDAVMVQNRLQAACDSDLTTVLSSSGITGMVENMQDFLKENPPPVFLYGCYKGFVYSFFNLIPTLTTVLGVSALPNLATAWFGKDKKAIKTNVESVIRVTSLMVIPIGLIFTVLAQPILQMFYSKRPVGANVSVSLLQILAISAIFAGISVPITSMLQAIGKQKIPVRNLLIGVAIKIVLNYILVGIPEINVNGAAYSTIACYAVILLLNFISLHRNIRIGYNYFNLLVKPLIAGIFCAAAGYAAFGLLERMFGNNISLMGALGIAGIIYIFSVFLIRAIAEDDIKMLPKGEKFAKTLAKFKFIG